MKEPTKKKLQEWFTKLTTFKENELHPLVWIVGDPILGKNVYIGAFSEINANKSEVYIGDNCDIASFVSINCADSHRRCLGKTKEVIRKKIKLENNVFVGSHSVIKGGAHIGHHSVIAAGTIVEPGSIPPYSLIVGNPMQIKPGYYDTKK
jgi:acetyltransferase-like isoleucine patch superfamily enzyme